MLRGPARQAADRVADLEREAVKVGMTLGTVALAAVGCRRRPLFLACSSHYSEHWVPCCPATGVGVLCLPVGDRTVACAGRRMSGRKAAGGETAGPAGGTEGAGVVATRSSGPLAQSGDAVRLVAQIEAVAVGLGAAEAAAQTAVAVGKECFGGHFLATAGTGGKFAGCPVVPAHLGHAAERSGGGGLARFAG